MTAFIEKELMEEARVLAAEILSEINPDLSVTENMIRSLQMRTTDLDAEAVVHDLRAGMDQFHEVYADANAQGLEAVISHNLDDILGQLAEEEQQKLLMDILQTCADAAGSAIPEGMDPEQMKQSACHCLSEYGMVLAGTDVYLQLAELDEESLEAIAEASASGQEEAYIALAVYILKAIGKMEGVKEELNPTQIGAMTAATLTALDAMVEAAEAETENETEEEKKDRFAKLKKVLKIIAGVLSIVTIVAVMSVPGLVCLSEVIELLDTTYCSIVFFEDIVMACVCMIPAVIFFGSAIQGSVHVAKRSGIAGELAKVYRKIAEFVTQSLVPSGKHYWDAMVEEAKVSPENRDATVVAEYTAEGKEAAQYAFDDNLEIAEEDSDEEDVYIF